MKIIPKIIPKLGPKLYDKFSFNLADAVPSDIKSLITATNGSLRTLAGPTALYSAAAGQVPDGAGGVQESSIPPIGEHGYGADVAYTNLFASNLVDFANWTASGGVVSDNLLTENSINQDHRVYANRSSVDPSNISVEAKHAGRFLQITTETDYVNFDLQNFSIAQESGCTGAIEIIGDGWCRCSVTGLAGGDYISFVLVNSGTANRIPSYQGDGVSGVYLRRPHVTNGPYLHEYIPPGQSVVSTVGTTTGNGVSVPLTGSDKADRLIECFRGVPDGVELIANAADREFSSDTGFWTKSAGVAITGGSLVFGSGSIVDEGAVGETVLTIGERYLFTGTISEYSSGGVQLFSAATPVKNSNGFFSVEHTVTSISPGIYASANNTSLKIDNISIQKLSPAVGTVAVLMRMGVGSGELPLDFQGGSVSSVSGVFNNLLYFRRTITDSEYSAIGDDNNNTALTPPLGDASWLANEYHAKVVEFNGTKFRVGNQRYNEDGTAIDADIVWSHASLAAGATFDGSFNPTTFLRWFLNSTVPNHMKTHFVSNQVGLGNTEIIRRLRKYGKFF